MPTTESAKINRKFAIVDPFPVPKTSSMPWNRRLYLMDGAITETFFTPAGGFIPTGTFKGIHFIGLQV
jgi:hypothetical protein